MDDMITIKEYARLKGKSVQSVYKQIKSKENAKALEGHIHIRKIGNKDTKLIDQEGIDILDNASRQAPTVIVQNNLAEQNEQLKETINNLQIRLLQEQEKNNNLLEKLNTVKLENLDMKHLIETKDSEKAHQEEKFEQVKFEKEIWKAEAESFKPSLFGFYRKK